MSNKSRKYKLTVAGQLFKHLGLQMYSGAVPAISELVSNAYDAMAKNVWITIPTGRAIRQTDQVIVKDDGHGMNFDECNILYLLIGRNRRSGGKEWTDPYNDLNSRKVHGRKGIGKLAGFGIANVIDVRSVKDEEIAHFEMDYEALTGKDAFVDTDGYELKSLPDDGNDTGERSNTTITLSRLKIIRAINEESFKRSIARRLLVLDENFSVHVNGTTISRDEIPFQFRFPTGIGEWETAELEGGNQIEWWAGFCKDTIPDEEQRGFVVYARRKLAQTPWFFDLSGGVWGQHGMQYLTGEIQADFLDEAVDLIATDRGTVRWEDPIAVPLKEWGRRKVRELLEAWADKRRVEKIRSPKVALYIKQAEKLPDNDRRIFKNVVDRICAIPQLGKHKDGQDITDELIGFVYNAMTNRNFLEAIKRLNTASPEDIANFEKVLSDWDIIEAINTAHLVKGRVEIIQKFSQMIKDRVPEKPNMQNYLRDHPWLIDPKWTMLAHEQSLDRMIRDEFGASSSGSAEGSRRFDFFCLGDRYQTAHIVETKRPGALVGREECDQIRDYVLFLRKKLQEESSDQQNRRSMVKGLLIADRIRSGDDGHVKMGQDSGIFDVRSWDNLLTTAESMHKEFLDAVTKRAPSDDPRIVQLSKENGSDVPT